MQSWNFRYLFYNLCFIILVHTTYASTGSTEIKPRIIGYHLLGDNQKWVNGTLEVPTGVDLKFTLYGVNLDKIDYITFSDQSMMEGQNCDITRSTSGYKVDNKTRYSAQVLVNLDHPSKENEKLYFCLKLNTTSNQQWIYQSISENLEFRAYETEEVLTFWQNFLRKSLQIGMFIILFFLSGLFSGLNLGLMSLDYTTLTMIENGGEEDEKKYAKIIRPVRKHGNYLLCTLLLGNVMVNNSLAILTGNLIGSGMLAIVASTFGIVVLGEVIPQSLCSRYALYIGAKTIWITKMLMVLTGIVSLPLGLLLDRILGKDLGQEYNRKKLDALIKEQQKRGLVDAEEAEIIYGALTITTKQVKEIMTKIEDVFMIPYNAVLDFSLFNEISAQGFTRVPVYDENKSSIKALLNVKDLLITNPNDKMLVSTLCKFYKRSFLKVKEDTTLKSLFEEFRKGKTHMAVVESNTDERKLIGIATLEDVIESVFQREIMDETDKYTDNEHKQERGLVNNDFRFFNNFKEEHYKKISGDFKCAIFKYLTSECEPFHPNFVASEVLQSMLNANILIDTNKAHMKGKLLYTAGEDVNYAILVIQGEVAVEFDSEKITFPAGPFRLLGLGLLEMINEKVKNFPDMDQTNVPFHINELSKSIVFKPGYTVTVTQPVKFLKITSRHYLLARMFSQSQDISSVTSSDDGNFYQQKWEEYFEPMTNKTRFLCENGVKDNAHIVDINQLRRLSSL